MPALRRLPIAMALLAAASAAETASAQYAAEMAELQALTAQRDLDLYELEFAPLVLDRLVATDRTGGTAVFNYLVFRIRNQATDSTTTLQLKAKGYNEVLQAITKQYEIAKVTSEGGVKLAVDGVADPADAVILERQESKPKQRTVRLSAIAYDERGTRMRLLDEEPGQGPQESFAFPDLGNTRRAWSLASVRERIEEQVKRRLYTPDQIRAIPLDPFDGVKRVEVEDINDPAFDRRGWFVGELYGVLIFDRFDDHGQKLTIEIQGLSNKFRTRHPPIEPGRPANWAETRVMRRTWVLRYDWPGDPFFRQDDSFALTSSGWAWVDSFQRQDKRADVALARYFLDNIQDERGERRAAVEAEFWAYYNQVRESRRGTKHGDALPDFEKLTKEQ